MSERDDVVEAALVASVNADDTGMTAFSARTLMEWAIDQYTDDQSVREELPRKIMRAALDAINAPAAFNTLENINANVRRDLSNLSREQMLHMLQIIQVLTSGWVKQDKEDGR